jgi:hypothetical protein
MEGQVIGIGRRAALERDGEDVSACFQPTTGLTQVFDATETDRRSKRST